jgi:hypothetical protein
MMRAGILLWLSLLASSAAPAETSPGGTPPAPPTSAPTVSGVSDADAPEPIQITGDVKPPVLLRQVAPRLTESERSSGLLVLEGVINTRGRVESVKILKDETDPRIGPLYAAAFKKWRYGPATLAGKPVRVFLTLSMNIDLR